MDDGMICLLVVFWIICAIAGGMMLSRFDKSGTGFLLGGLFGPIGLIIAWTMRDDAKTDHVATTRQHSQLAVRPETVRDERECPYCAELILLKARVCKHCKREVMPDAEKVDDLDMEAAQREFQTPRPITETVEDLDKEAERRAFQSPRRGRKKD